MNLFASLLHKPTHRVVWSLAGPMILSNLTVPLLGMVDTAVVGHLDEPYHLGAVAVGAMIFGVVFWGFGFLRMGTTGLSAHALGGQDYNEVRALLGRALILAGSFAFVLLILQTPIQRLAFYLMAPSASVEYHAVSYFEIRIASAPATLANYVIVGWFLGVQNARVPLILLLFINSINMVLDVILVVGLSFGVEGVAWASFCAEYCGLMLGFYLISMELKKYPGLWQKQLIFDMVKFRRMLLLNQDIFIRTLCLMFTLAFFTAQGSRMGDVILAANAVLFQFYTFMAYGLDGFAHAAEALVGKNVGAKDRNGFVRSIAVALSWALLVGVGFTLIYFFIGQQIIALLTDIELVRNTAEQYLLWLILLPLISVWSFLLDGIYIGVMRTAEMRNTMLFSTVLVFLPAWYLLSGFGNHGLWFAYVLFMVSRAATMGVLFLMLDRRVRFAS